MPVLKDNLPDLHPFWKEWQLQQFENSRIWILFRNKFILSFLIWASCCVYKQWRSMGVKSFRIELLPFPFLVETTFTMARLIYVPTKILNHHTMKSQFDCNFCRMYLNSYSTFGKSLSCTIKGNSRGTVWKKKIILEILSRYKFEAWEFTAFLHDIIPRNGFYLPTQSHIPWFICSIQTPCFEMELFQRRFKVNDGDWLTFSSKT